MKITTFFKSFNVVIFTGYMMSADLLQLKLPFPWEVSHHLDDAALRGAAYYALRTREECTEVLPKISL